jgi:hypothetical protein
MAETKTETAAIIAPAPPSKIAEDAIREHHKTGGSTFDPRTGENLAGTRNIAVGIAPEHAVIHSHPPTPEFYDNFIRANQAVLSKHSHSAVGTAHDPNTGLHHTEIVGLTPSKLAAVEMAQHLGEGHVYNLATDEKIPAGIGGNSQLSPTSVDERFDHLRARSPQRQPYTGTHFSFEKIDGKIEGARRGELGAKKMAPSNADHNRVHLGTKTGQGPDAPAGFYTTRAGSSAHALAAAKHHSVQVRGKFALATTDHPAFQSGYQQGSQSAAAAGADPKTTHLLGLNAAEHSLSDAGFDGYTAAKHPGTVFHFGSHKIEDEPKPQVK